MDLDDDDELDELDEILELDGEEFDRRLEQYVEKHPPRCQLPPDLSELFRAISREAILRSSWDPDTPPYSFEGFEAYDAVIGGMGLVIEARDPVLDRKVAIKLWKQSGPQAQAALLAEAQTLAKLSHPNVVTVYETGCWRDRVLFVMEWIEGVDGHAWLAEARRWQEVREVFVAAGKGLAAAHDAGIQHRDFKPANVLIGADGRVVVADFGVADSLRSVDDEEDPQWGTPAGTPTYMAPERLRGWRGDARSDQFSFCVAMWRGLYGQRPFAGETGDELLAAIEAEEPCEPPGVEVPAWLRAVVRKGLAAKPEARFGDMHELVAALLEGPGDDDGRTLLSALGSVPRGSALALWLPMVLVGGAVLGGLGVWMMVGADESEPRGVGEVRPSEPVARPCADADGGGIDVVDPVVLEVCGLIREHHMQAADAFWEREYEFRLAATDANVLLGEQALIVATTFVDEAERLRSGNPALARAASRYARVWVLKAGKHLGEDVDVRRISTRVDRLLAGPPTRR